MRNDKPMRGKTYRKAFITLHTAAFPVAADDMSEAQAKKWAAIVKPNAGKELVIAVDAIRAVVSSSMSTAITVKSKTRGGADVGVPFRTGNCETSLVYVLGNTRYAVAETVPEVRALIATAMAEAGVE